MHFAQKTSFFKIVVDFYSHYGIIYWHRYQKEGFYMTKTVDYKTHGTCSRMIHVEIEDGIVRDVKFAGGCNGNTQGVAKLAIGRKADEVVSLLKGTDCGGRGTSCPDQLAKAIEEAMAK